MKIVIDWKVLSWVIITLAVIAVVWLNIANNNIKNPFDGSSLGDGLVLWYDFENVTDGVVYDKSGNGYDGVIMPNGTDGPQVVDGKFGEALSFDGVDDYVVISSNLNNMENFTDEITVSVWAKNGYIDYYSGIFTCDNDLLFFPYNKYMFSIRTENKNRSVVSSEKVYENNKWYFIVGTYDGEKLKIYVNGRLEDVEFTSGKIKNECIINIGKRSSGYPFKGKLGSVRIWNRSLDESEIKSLYVGIKNVFLFSNECSFLK